MKGFPIAHIFHPSIPPMHAVVNNHNRNIDYWTVKRKFAEIVSTNDVNKIYSISNEPVSYTHLTLPTICSV